MPRGGLGFLHRHLPVPLVRNGGCEASWLGNNKRPSFGDPGENSHDPSEVAMSGGETSCLVSGGARGNALRGVYGESAPLPLLAL